MTQDATTNGARNAVGSFSQQRLDRMRFARQAGFQYDGDRDVYRIAGYVPEDGLEFSHFWSRYRRDPIAGRIVDLPAMTTWRNPPTVIETDSDPDEPTEFMQAFEGLSDRLKLWHRLERSDRLAGIGRYGVLLIGQAGDSRLDTELARMQGPDDVIYLSSFHEGHATIAAWDTDTSSPRFGLPLMYEIELASGVSGFPDAVAPKVHYSRVVHIAEDLLADEIFGRPRLERVHNSIQDMEKVSAATGEAYWQLADRILQLAIDPDASVGEEDLKELGQAVEETYHDLRRHITLQGGELSWLSGDVPDPSGAMDLYFTLFAVGTGTPKRIMFGSETGERASSEDQKTWLGQIGERQERFAEPTMLRPLIDRLIEYGALPDPRGYDVEWPNLFETPAKEIAETDQTVADTAKALAPIGASPLELVTIEDGRVTLKPTAELDPSLFEPVMPPPGFGGPGGLPGGDDDDGDDGDADE